MENIKNHIKHLNIPFWWAVFVIIVCVACCTSCKTKYVTVPEYHTLYRTRVDTVQRWDSVRDVQWMTVREVDSTQLAALGLQIHGLKNALLLERNRLLQKMSNEKTHKVDTIMQRDSIPMPYPVEKSLSKWEQAKMDFGGIAIGGTLALVILVIVRVTKRLK